ncbi:TPA: hypothetical protein HA338_06270 [Methanosarcina acetivorans]|uniref:Uncharacterized protein n=1 Tax=Methanosarcina acetivorans TaxID=2214 RepID=A0A832SK34_9EURY|nr:hypothetical protein [Methanosarcina acetivorans]HIH93645.1 hypothetical protein [Methanosarcina acetivorans]
MTQGPDIHTVTEAKQAMRRLEKDIMSIITEFEDEYGITVQDIGTGVSEKLTENGTRTRTSSVRIYGGI